MNLFRRGCRIYLCTYSIYFAYTNKCMIVFYCVQTFLSSTCPNRIMLKVIAEAAHAYRLKMSNQCLRAPICSKSRILLLEHKWKARAYAIRLSKYSFASFISLFESTNFLFLFTYIYQLLKVQIHCKFLKVTYRIYYSKYIVLQFKVGVPAILLRSANSNVEQ